MSRRVCLALLLSFGLAAPWAQARVKVPLPRPKPEATAEPQALVIPLPRPKPKRGDEPAVNTEVEEPVPAAAVGATAIVARLSETGDGGSWSADSIRAARLECAQLLNGLSLIWVPDKPFGGPGGCGTAMPIAVSEIAGIRINPPATLNCAMAAALHRWLSQSVKPAAKREIGRQISEIRNASSFACRSRNNVRGAKLSEHGRANAFDISAFVFGKGEEVTVKGDWSGLWQTVGLSGRGAFLRVVRKDSCDYFSTVLGPGSDSYHRDHFHVDLAERRNKGKYCK